MCSATYIAAGSAILGLATAVQQHQEGQQVARRSARSGKAAAEEIRKAENIALTENTRRIFEEKQAASEKRQEARIKGAEARAAAEVGASSAGVRGISVSALLANLSRQEGKSVTGIDSNLLSMERSLMGERKAIQRQTKSSLASIPKVQGPGLTSLLLNSGAALVGAGNAYTSAKGAGL